MALRYWGVIFILGLGWGMSFMFNAILLRELGPLSVSLGRVGLGALGCWAYVAFCGSDWRLPRRTVLALLGFGVLSYAAPFTCYVLGQQHIASGVAGIVNATTPALAVVAAHFWPGGERATFLKSTGVLAGVLGMGVLSVPILQTGGSSQIWAVIVTLGAPLCYAISVNVARRFRGIEPVVLVAWALTGATLCLLPMAVWQDGAPSHLSLATVGALMVLGFVLTSAAFIVFYWIMPKVGPTNITLPTLIAPASALFLGIWVLNEPLLASHLVGLGLILFGLLLIDGRLFGWRAPA